MSGGAPYSLTQGGATGPSLRASTPAACRLSSLLPAACLFLRASTEGRHPPSSGQIKNVYHGLAFHGLAWIPWIGAYWRIFNREIMSFYCELGEKFGQQTF